MLKLLFLLGLSCATRMFGDTHTVINTLDSGPGSLRQAIIDANNDSNFPRIITFSIDSGVQTIQPLTALPALTAPYITIDGTSQVGWSAGNPVIVLDGEHSHYGFDGLVIQGTHNCTVQGLVISHGFLRGISIKEEASDNAIYDCFVGVDQTGSLARANAIGIMVSALDLQHNNTTIFGAPGHGNVISGNNYMGVFLSGNVCNARIQSNRIGTDVTGSVALGNAKAGIVIGTFPVDASLACMGGLIGGVLAQEGNVISGNGVGVVFGYQSISALTIEGNIFGYDSAGLSPLPNGKNILTIQSMASCSENLLIQHNLTY